MLCVVLIDWKFQLKKSSTIYNPAQPASHTQHAQAPLPPIHGGASTVTVAAAAAAAAARAHHKQATPYRNLQQEQAKKKKKSKIKYNNRRNRIRRTIHQ